MIRRNHTGHRCGQSHPHAKLTDAQIKAMRAEYQPGKIGYRTLMKKYGCGESTVRDICTYRTRWIE